MTTMQATTTTTPSRGLWLWLTVCLLSVFSTSVAAVEGNSYPIILVHGFAGWGREEMAGMKYWGGFHGDWQQDLVDEGFDVRTATVGPFSSNWDRACELYAFIKGGTVNYGANHAQTHGHNATGPTFPGIFPEWGTVVDGELQKVHLLAHSMGGQTVRMLAQLLAEGTKGAPIAEDPTSHPLFEGGKNWIHSITTVASPNQGTLLANIAKTLGSTMEKLVSTFTSVVELLGASSTTLFDAKLDQWGISPRAEGEGLKEYFARVTSSAVFQNGDADKDLCIYSLSTVGAAEENAWVNTRPDIFYYSISNRDTFHLGWVELPRSFSMLLPLQPLSVFLGSTYPTKNGYNDEWQPNDGVVNTLSMVSDGKAEVVQGVDESATGRWHHVGLFKTLDHESMVGTKISKNIIDVYKAHVRVLYELPLASSAARRLRGGPVVHRHLAETTRRLSAAIEAANAHHDGQDAERACADPVDPAIQELCDAHFGQR